MDEKMLLGSELGMTQLAPENGVGVQDPNYSFTPDAEFILQTSVEKVYITLVEKIDSLDEIPAFAVLAFIYYTFERNNTGFLFRRFSPAHQAIF